NFCQWAPPEECSNISVIHIPLILYLWNEAMDHNLFQLNQDMASKVLDSILEQTMKFLAPYPHKQEIIFDIYEKLQKIFMSLVQKNILPNDRFERHFIRTVLTAPLESLIQKERRDEVVKMHAERFFWLNVVVQESILTMNLTLDVC